MQDRLRHSQRVAAARAGFSERTGRRIDADPRLPSQRKPERGRTDADPLAAVWETVLPILERDPAVQAVTAPAPSADCRPVPSPTTASAGRWATGARLARAARAGARRDLPPDVRAGRMPLGLHRRGRPRRHHRRCAVPAPALPLRAGLQRLEHAAVVLGGESFTALAENLQNALWALGGVPDEHRSDSLSAAYRNLDAEAART